MDFCTNKLQKGSCGLTAPRPQLVDTGRVDFHVTKTIKLSMSATRPTRQHIPMFLER